MRGSWKKLTEVDFQTACSMLAKGMAVSDIAKVFLVSRQNMHGLFVRRGIITPQPRTSAPLQPKPKFKPFVPRTYGEKQAKLRERAWSAVHIAIKKGILRRDACEVCGDEKAEAHHDDYTKPLDVRWLCNKHHNEWHNIHGKGKYTGLRLECREANSGGFRQVTKVE